MKKGRKVHVWNDSRRVRAWRPAEAGVKSCGWPVAGSAFSRCCPPRARRLPIAIFLLPFLSFAAYLPRQVRRHKSRARVWRG